MTERKYTRLQLASFQLEAAIGLYITGRDRFSVITLAGAADTILSTLVIKNGKETFTEHLLEKTANEGGTVMSRADFGRAINDLLGINALKHLDDNDDGIVDLDPEECALAAILKALPNYLILEGHDHNLFLAFRLWVSENLNPQKYNVNFDPNWVRG
jgi:hypothetical protein